MDFKVFGDITNIEVIARGSSIRINRYLNKTYGRGRWRKLKGNASVEYNNHEIWLVELHWFEAHGIGRKRMKVKRRIRRIS